MDDEAKAIADEQDEDEAKAIADEQEKVQAVLQPGQWVEFRPQRDDAALTKENAEYAARQAKVYDDFKKNNQPGSEKK